MSTLLSDGWYRVVIVVNNPPKDYAKQYEEWVHLINGAWDLVGMGDVFVESILECEGELHTTNDKT